MRVGMGGVIRLTSALVRRLPFTESADKRVEYRDAEQSGLVLRVGNATRTYYVFYRVKLRSGRSKEVKIRLGRVEDMSLLDARAKARAVIRGGDPGRAPEHLWLPEGVQISDILPWEQLLTTQEAAALTKMSVAWYERKRWEGNGPPYRRRGRTIRYLKSELMAWWTARGIV